MKNFVSLMFLLITSFSCYAASTAVSAGESCAERSAYDVQYDAYSKGLLVCFNRKWEPHPLRVVKTIKAVDTEYVAIIQTSDNVCVKDRAIPNGMQYASLSGKPIGVRTWQHVFQLVRCPSVNTSPRKR